MGNVFTGESAEKYKVGRNCLLNKAFLPKIQEYSDRNTGNKLLLQKRVKSVDFQLPTVCTDKMPKIVQ